MYDPFYDPNLPENPRRSQRMESAALILGVISLFSSCLVYPALICGALGIAFALLSRGGERTLTPRARAALIMSSVGLAVVVFMIVYTVALTYLYFDGIQDMLRHVCQSVGIDYDTLMRSLSR